MSNYLSNTLYKYGYNDYIVIARGERFIPLRTFPEINSCLSDRIKKLIDKGYHHPAKLNLELSIELHIAHIMHKYCKA